jgi:hypothetical protein
MTNREVVAAWSRGEPGQSGSVRTDGQTLWSYGLVIGQTREGSKVAWDFRARTGNFKSSTTSKHVSFATGVADVVEVPA